MNRDRLAAVLTVLRKTYAHMSWKEFERTYT